ncbi:MAG: sigma-70 family RNA polymerase sigma factor [Actinomycetota bacterium]
MRARPYDEVWDPALAWIEAAQRGDEDAFGQLYRLHRPAIVRMARLHVGIDGDDLVAEVFLRAWTGLPTYRPTGVPFVAWLYGIARHVIVDQVRREARSTPRETLPDAIVEFAEDDRMMLAEAIDGLPDEQRQVIELKYLLGLRNPEVAEALGVSIGAVNAKQWRALQTLRDRLEGER